MKINDKEWMKKFKSKERLNCAGCGATKLRPVPASLPDTDVSEAVMLICSCGHQRLELM